MKMFLYTLVLPSLLGLGLVACAPVSAQPNPASAYSSETGSQVQQRLGPPDETDKLPNGDTLLIYRWSRVQSSGGYTTSGGGPYTGSSLNLGRQYVPTRTVNLNCMAQFTVAPDDTVRGAELQGNACFSEAR